jgi:sugar phosphate isomerase/epimerase
MWGMKNFPYFPDFFPAAERLGFAGVELNHQVTPGMLEGVDLERYRVGSLHEPCPAVISAAELKKRDLLISSPAEDHRREGVDSIKRTIDLAAELGCQTVVVHCGQIQGDISLEFRLKDMCDSGQCGTPEFIEVKERFITRRASLAGPYLESVRKSLVELLEYVGHSNIRLGLENRFHFFDIPNGEEMSYLLDVAGPERLGVVYDIGHASFQDRLGFASHAAWLEKYAGRIVGVHIHDFRGIQDHLAPGRGEVEFKKLAAHIPAGAFRTLEVMPSNTAEEIAAGMEILVDAGCVNRL